jgi:hypothetical protein
MNVDSELIEAQLENRDTDVVHSPNKKGMTWYNRAADKIKALFDSEVKTIATEDWVENKLTNSEDGLIAAGLVLAEQPAVPTTPAMDKQSFYPKSDGFYELDDQGIESRVVTDNNISPYILAEVGFKKKITIDVTKTDSNDPYNQSFYTFPDHGLVILKRAHYSGSVTLNINVGSKSFSKTHTNNWLDYNEIIYVKAGDTMTMIGETNYSTSRTGKIQAEYLKLA